MARTVMYPSHATAPHRPEFTRLPNGLALHAPPVEAARPLLPRRVPLSAIALLLFALAGWAGLLAWTRPAAPCATCLSEPGQL